MTLASALFSPSQQKLLPVLFSDVSKVHHLRELIRETGLGSASLQRELSRLIEAGLVLDARRGNLREFSVNERSPLFSELRSLVDKTLGTTAVLKGALQSISDRVDLALIYGSVAKQSDHSSSDIDLLVVAQGLTLGALLQQLAPAEQRLGRTINSSLYTPEEFLRRRSETDSFIQRILSGPTIPIIGNDDGR